MTHGAPDWSKYRPDSTTHPVQDLAELAARLGSIVTFDKRGDVMFLEDFGTGLQDWSISAEGIGASVTLSPTTFHSPGYSAKLVTGAAVAMSTEIGHVRSYPREGDHGFECSFTWHASHVDFRILAYIQTATTLYQPQLRYVNANNMLYYLNASNVEVPLTGSPVLPTVGAPFHTIKLVVDPVSKQYKRALLNHVQWDLSNLSMYSTGVVTSPFLALYLRYTGPSGTAVTGYLDNVIITQDEP